MEPGANTCFSFNRRKPIEASSGRIPAHGRCHTAIRPRSVALLTPLPKPLSRKDRPAPGIGVFAACSSLAAHDVSLDPSISGDSLSMDPPAQPTRVVRGVAPMGRRSRAGDIGKKMIVKLRDLKYEPAGSGCHLLPDRTLGAAPAPPLAAATDLLDPGDSEPPSSGCNMSSVRLNILTHHAQIAAQSAQHCRASSSPTLAGIVASRTLDVDASAGARGSSVPLVLDLRRWALHRPRPTAVCKLQGQSSLLDLALDLFDVCRRPASCTLRSEAEALKPAGSVDPHVAEILAFSACKAANHRLQYGGIIGEGFVTFDMHMATTMHV